MELLSRRSHGTNSYPVSCQSLGERIDMSFRGLKLPAKRKSHPVTQIAPNKSTSVVISIPVIIHEEGTERENQGPERRV